MKGAGFIMRRVGGPMAVVALALPASAGARAADVVITNTQANPAVVALAQGGNTVRIDTSAAPVTTQELQQLFGDTMKLTASNGAVTCEKINLADARAIRLESVLAESSGATPPTAVFITLFGERIPGAVDGLDLPIPQTPVAGSYGNYSGQLQTGFPVIGGLPTAPQAAGKPADVRGCIRAPANATVEARMIFTGIYLN